MAVSALLVTSLLPAPAWAVPPDTPRDGVALPELQGTTAAMPDTAKIESFTSWSGTPASPPDEYNPTAVAPLDTAAEPVDLSNVGDQLRQVQNLPVRMGKATMGTTTTPPDPSGQWWVEVKPKEATEADVLNGAILKVTPPTTGSTPVDLELDYSRFEDLYGNEWATRLKLVQLPECFLSTPDLDSCNTPVEVPSTNDPVAKTIRATVDPAASQAQGLSTQSGGGPTVLAATDSGAGAGGTYRATSLGASGSWSAGGSSGGFSWSYPLTVPAPPAGPAPKIAFNYSSQSVDGKTSVTNGQASWVGDGWDYHPGFIERRYRTCSDDLVNGNNNNATDKKKSDLCWASDNVVMSLGGSTTELVHDGTRWVPANDDGSKVEYLDSAGIPKTTAQDSKYNGEHWRVSTRDGTRYYFGRNDVDGTTGTRALTDSVSKVPVFGNQSGEPCHQAAYADSSCEQAWRWNLDYVEDVHGNAMVIDWKQEKNLYARNGKFKPAVSYDRASYPTQILYGLRAGNLGGAPAGRVKFGVDQRCIRVGTVSCNDTEFESKNYEDKQPWWDTPATLNCSSTTTNCYVGSPTFWSRMMLTSVSTEAQRTPGSTALSPVDTWTLKHSFPYQRTDTHPPLWLEAIDRTGYGTEKDADGDNSTPLPSVSFLPNVVDMPNRVKSGSNDPTPGFDRLRVETIRTETGGEIQVEYSAPCLPTDIPASPEGNKSRCFPSKWSPDPEVENPKIEWFNKYIVRSVTEKDRATRQPDVKTTYKYDETAGAAWAKNTDEFVKPELRTYDQWRGYNKVGVYKGVTSAVGATPSTEESRTVTRYFRGMSKDAGGTVVNLSLKKADGTDETVEDQLAYQGRAAEVTTYTRNGGTVLSREVSLPSAVTTATRVRGGGLPDLNAYRVNTEWTQSIETLSDGTTRTKVTDPTFETTYGLPATSYTYTLAADGKTKADETCTTTTYVHKNTADTYLIGLPQRVRATVGDCGAATAATGNKIISDVRTSYDALNAFGTAPTKGLPRQVDTIDETGSGWIPTVRTKYDELGRVTEVMDANDKATTTIYSPATGPAFQTTVTNALSQSSVSTVDPGRGSVLSVTDPNGRKTTSKYDGLGRVVAVWSPSRNPDTDSPSARFTYQIKGDLVPAVTTETLRDNGTYTMSVAIYDGNLRPRQTQTEAAGGGRIITDTLYNVNGAVSETKNGYYDKDEPEPETFVPASSYLVPNSTKISYDGLGRAIRTTTVYKGTDQYSSTVQYGGDWTLTRTGMSVDGTTPLSGSRAVKTWTDAADRTVKVQHYTTTDLSASLDTLYAYDPRGKLATVTAPKQNTWTYAYDVRGRLTASKDPDMGAASFGYDDLDRQVWAKDSLNRAQYTTYDALGRKTELRDDSATGPLVSKWTYDTLTGAKGYPVASTRYYGGAAYTSEITGYDTEYRPTGTKITIPDVVNTTTGLAGTYAYSSTYTLTGKPQSVTLPATPGGLAAEKVITRYNAEGMPITTSGLDWYTTDTIYSPFGDVLRTTSGDAGRRVWTTNEYDESTGRLSKAYDHRETQPSLISTLNYGYDTVGNTTSITETQPDTTVPSTKIDWQCFAYDPMGRLVEAWTGIDKCPTSGTTQGAGPTRAQLSSGVDGSGYWHSYTFDTIGNRAGLTVHDPTDEKLDDNYSYTYGKTVTNNGTQAPELVQPHTLVQADSKVVTSTTTVESRSTYGYDATGNTTDRVINGDTQSLTWDRRNKLTSVSGFGSGKGAFTNAISGKCLDVEGGKSTDGTAIQIYACNGSKAQQWKLSGGTLKALGKCATVSGTALVLSACVDKSTAQQFVSRPDDQSLYNAAANLCVDVPSADDTNGKNLQLYSCNKSNAQKWTPSDTTSYLYDASGNRLIELTGTTRTLFLGESEITVNTSGQALNAQRYYAHPGAPTTVRTTNGKTTGHKLTVLLSDQHGTSSTAVDQTNGQAITRRYYDPYGNPRGAEPSNWPDRHTFLGTGVDDSTTGLTHIGAREYDPTAGRFLSADPVIDITDALQMNGYTYANGSPTTLSDPSGLAPDDCGRGGVSCSPTGNGGWNTEKNSEWGKYNRDYSPNGCSVCQENILIGVTADVITDVAKKYLSPKRYAAWNRVYQERLDRIRHDYSEVSQDDLLAEADGSCTGPEAYDCPEGLKKAFWDMDTARAAQYNGYEDRGGIAPMGRTAAELRAKLEKIGGLKGSSGGPCSPNSFVSGTPVLMADGTNKPIEEVEAGDNVLATDPETGETGSKRVTASIFTRDDKTYVNLAIADADGLDTLTATDHHPFWVESERAWIDAGQLKPGMTLRTDVGTTVTVSAVRIYEAKQDTYNLTVADLHTYYVLAGSTSVLVHNTSCVNVTDLGGGRLRTPAGLIYGPMRGGEGHRIFHVGAHTAESLKPNKNNHSIFTGQQSPLELVDEAWLKRGDAEPNDPAAYVVPMGRVIGDGGQTSIRIIVKPGTTEVISAYPY
ncbi:polymorphic toxin-type HINT domain-containing protein [Streptomyces sp. NPDC101160]|uniref:polymorphic toxin-type HINT domain-containing protein n=1 Tax=Streptomyces sp. NPDC101160 TaxID=3366118 RepID=UPI0038043181